MDKLNVVIVSAADLHRGYLEEIAAVDPRISVKEGVKQFIDELKRSGKKLLADRIERDAITWADPRPLEKLEKLDNLLSEAEVIMGRIVLPDNLIARAPKLKWMAIQGAGIDPLLSTGLLNSHVTITNARGARAITIAEHAIAFIFMMAKDAPRLVSIKQSKKWERFDTMELTGKTLGIVGLGAIGSEAARMAKSIGMRVIAIKRSAKERKTGASGVDELYPTHDLLQLLHDSDFVLISAPLTTETKGMIGDKELRAMKPTAYLINIARGRIVDEPSLIRALKENWIAGAGLDVFDAEPLPPDSEFWNLPNAIMSCHMSGATVEASNREFDLFLKNLRKYLAGEQLLNVIDKQKDY